MTPIPTAGVVYVTVARRLRGSEDEITCLHIPAWVSESEQQGLAVVTGCMDGTARYYSPFAAGRSQEDCDCDHVLRSHTEPISAVCTHASRRLIFTASHDTTVCEWDARGSLVHTYEGHSAPVLAVLCMLDEMYSSDSDGAVISWHGRMRTAIHTFRGHVGPVVGLHPHGDRCFVSAGADGSLRLWVRKEGLPAARVFQGDGPPITSAVVESTGDSVFAATCTNPTSLPLPSTVPSAAELKAEAARRASGANVASPKHACRSWALSSGWSRQRFPSDVTCMTVAAGAVSSLITGHRSGEVCGWLTQGCDAEAQRMQTQLDKLNAKLEALEEKLEEMRVAERRSADVLAAQKANRRLWYGFSLLLTSAGPDLPSKVGLCALQVSSREPLAEPGQVAEPKHTGLRTLFANSIGARPELLWTGLVQLNRHCAAEEAAVAQSYKDAVDEVREEIAGVRKESVTADRRLSAHLSTGQLRRRFRARGLRGPITTVTSSGGVVYASDGCGAVWGWDLADGWLRYRLNGFDTPLRFLSAHCGQIVGASGPDVYIWSPQPMPKRDSGGARVVRARRSLPPEVSAVAQPGADAGPGLPGEREIHAAFERFDADADGRISIDEFWKFWDSLDHCGLGDRRDALRVLEEAGARRQRTAPKVPRHTVPRRLAAVGGAKHLWGTETHGSEPPARPLQGAAVRTLRAKASLAAEHRSPDLTMSYDEFAQIMLRVAAR